MSVPVYFNDPTNILQQQCAGFEYHELLDEASKEPDSIRRLALVSIFSISMAAFIERSNTKPFNPLLGETYEYEHTHYRYFAEQVSHHPPITAIHMEGKAGYRVWSNIRPKTKFTGKSLQFHPTFRFYIEFDSTGEKFEITQCYISVHNLIIGTPYVDLGGKSCIRNLNIADEHCELEFYHRGWT